MDDNIHKDCIRFVKDFDTQKLQAIPIGRLILGEHIARLVLTTKGLTLGVSEAAVKSGNVFITPDFDEVELSGFGPQTKSTTNQTKG